MFNPIFLLMALSTIPFLFSYKGEFVFDDSQAVVKNKDVHGDLWMKAFVRDFWGQDIKSNESHKSYRPLSILSFRLNYIISGEKLVAPHFKLTNIVCHMICCLMAYRMFHILFRDVYSINEDFWSSKANLSALLFAVHPVHVECVAGIVGRADLLAAIMFFLSFHGYCKARMTFSKQKSFLHLLETIMFAGLAMLCKENGITVLGFCICCDVSNKFLKRHPTINYYQVHYLRIFFLTTAIVILVYARWLVMGGSKPVFQPVDNPAAFESNPFKKVMTFQYIYFLNAVLLIWPQWLCYDWSMGCVPVIRGFTDYRLVFVALLYAFGYLLLKHIIKARSYNMARRQIFLGASLIVVPFLPAANIFYPVGFVVAERILYIPSAGYCMLVVIGLSKIIAIKMLRKAGQFFFCLLIITFALKSWQRSYEWQNEHSLFTSALSVCPLNAKVHYNAAKVADDREETDLAVREYREAIRLFPMYYQALNNLANILKNLEQYDEAESFLRRAVSAKVDFPAAWMNLGIVLANTKRYNESNDAYEIAIKYRKNYPDCYYNMGYLYLEMNQSRRALEYFSKAIRLNSKHTLAWTNVLSLLDNTGQFSEAVSLIPTVLKDLNDSPAVHFTIANIYGKMDQHEDAEKHFLKAIKLFGDKVQPIHYSNLGVLYHRWKKYELAKEMYETALEIDPTFQTASQNLENVIRHIELANMYGRDRIIMVKSGRDRIITVTSEGTII